MGRAHTCACVQAKTPAQVKLDSLSALPDGYPVLEV